VLCSVKISAGKCNDVSSEELETGLYPVEASLIGAHLHEAGFKVLKNLPQSFPFATGLVRMRSLLEPALDNKC